MPITPFSLWRTTSRPAGRWLATSVGRPMPRLTTAPSPMSRATRAAICSRVQWGRVGAVLAFMAASPSIGLEAGAAGRGAFDRHDALHEQPGRDDRLRIERAERDHFVHGRDRAARRGRHDGSEVARGLAVDEVAPAVAALGLDEGEVG